MKSESNHKHKFKFRAHETFFIRKGWLYKGMKNVRLKPNVFTDKNENPMDILGIGSNMVKALRYWLQAVNLTIEPRAGVKSQTLTDLADIIWKNDRYIEEMGSLWLLHYQLASNEKNATAWYYFFNEFKMSEFKKEDFLFSIDNYVLLKHGEKVSNSSLADDFDCIINTYVSRIRSNPEKVHPESNIDCPFGELGLIDLANKKEKIYKKTQPKIDMIHPLILLSVIIDQANGKDEIKISDLLMKECNIGKIFNLDVISLTNHLYRIAQLGYIKVIRTAGLDIIKIRQQNMSFLDCVAAYYREINQ